LVLSTLVPSTSRRFGWVITIVLLSRAASDPQSRFYARPYWGGYVHCLFLCATSFFILIGDIAIVPLSSVLGTPLRRMMMPESVRESRTYARVQSEGLASNLALTTDSAPELMKLFGSRVALGAGIRK
jgi:hypothetical protein